MAGVDRQSRMSSDTQEVQLMLSAAETTAILPLQGSSLQDQFGEQGRERVQAQ